MISDHFNIRTHEFFRNRVSPKYYKILVANELKSADKLEVKFVQDVAAVYSLLNLELEDALLLIQEDREVLGNIVFDIVMSSDVWHV